MRTLRIVISSSRGALPALVLATLLPSGASCSRTGLRPGPPSAGGAASAEESASESASVAVSVSDGAGGFGPTTSSIATTGSGGGICDPFSQQQTFTVEVPAEGVPATPGQICAVSSPVESGDAARVTLVKDPQSIQKATGFIEVAAPLDGTVVGLPSVAVVNGWAPEVAEMQVTNVVPSAGGFSFDAAWPQPFAAKPESWALMSLKTTFQIACATGETRTVEALTFIRLCDENDVLTWVSSGDECTICRVIAEMAPSPIVTELAHDELPLARALRLRVVSLARVGRAVVLLAENDGGPGMSYAWRPSGGEVVELAPDVVLWTPPDGWGPHQIQAAVHGDDAAAVATFAWDMVA